MIEAPLRQSHPGHNPVGREPPVQSQRPSLSSLEERASVQDDVFDDRESREKASQSWTARHNAVGRGGAEAAWEEEVPETSETAADTTYRKSTESGRDGNTATQQDMAAAYEPPRFDLPKIVHDQEDQDVGLPDNHQRRRDLADSVSRISQKEKLPKLTPSATIESASPLESESSAASHDKPQVESSILPTPSFGRTNESSSDSTTRKGIQISRRAPESSDTIRTEEPMSRRNDEHVVFDAGDSGQGNAPRVVSRSASTSHASSRRLPGKTLPAHLQLRTTDGRRGSRHTPTPLRFKTGESEELAPKASIEDSMPSPMPQAIPLPPVSLPTYLQLELSSHRPPPLYIHRSVTSDFPYESSRVKIERLLNFLLLPPQLEQVLWFGAFACLDAWLYTFTILPLRLMKSFYILGQSWATNIATETKFVSSFTYAGAGRMWKRRRTRGSSAATSPSSLSLSKVHLLRRHSTSPDARPGPKPRAVNGSIGYSEQRRRASGTKRNANEDAIHRTRRRHRRTKSVPSALLPDDKADILKGLLIISTCLVLMRLDASRMYHWVRGQAAIKLYVLYNVLEVGDRLLSALGQDVLECLFSKEALERGPDGHSKVLRPFWLFLMALAYTVAHATALFYQVITLNVAVNSYSNALITLLMSNQFVEIKSTVFKKFEKENLFQLTCADVVERFQLWLMLLIIASRNVVETGGLSAGLSLFRSPPTGPPTSTNSSHPPMNQPSLSSASILPRSFTLLPNMLSSLTAYTPGIGHVLGPFLVVLGSEMMVDWLKHSYINKFNNTRPAIYGRFLDVLAKDYYSNAFGDQNLTKRLGLPVIPLSCLFIRASVQTYHMFQAAWIPSRLPSSASSSTDLSRHHHLHDGSYVMSSSTIPTSTAAALSQKFDTFLGQLPTAIASSWALSHLSSILIFLLVFLVLVTVKLVLGMLLLAFARSRYRSMKQREKDGSHYVEGCRRIGGWGVVEVDDDKRRWIYEGDAEGARQLREREEREQAGRERGSGDGWLEQVKRYEMVAKRIW